MNCFNNCGFGGSWIWIILILLLLTSGGFCFGSGGSICGNGCSSSCNPCC